MIIFRVVSMIFGVLFFAFWITIGVGGTVLERTARNPGVTPFSADSGFARDADERQRENNHYTTETVENDARDEEARRDRLDHGGARFAPGKPMIDPSQDND